MKRNLRTLLLTRVYNGRSTTIFCVTLCNKKIVEYYNQADSIIYNFVESLIHLCGDCIMCGCPMVSVLSLVQGLNYIFFFTSPGSMKISRRNPCSPFFSVSYSINGHKILQYLISIIVFIQYYTASWVGQGSAVRVSVSYSIVIALRLLIYMCPDLLIVDVCIIHQLPCLICNALKKITAHDVIAVYR